MIKLITDDAAGGNAKSMGKAPAAAPAELTDGDKSPRRQPDPTITKSIAGRCRKLGLNESAIQRAKHIYVTGPVRKPSGHRAVRGFYSSPIMRERLPFGSHTCELAFLDRAHDPAVGTWLIVPQPLGLRITAKIKGGTKEHTYDHIADYLWGTGKWVGYIECKRESDIKWVLDPKNPDQKPDFYVKQNGRWVCPAAKAAAKAQGLDHEMFVMTADEVQLTNNLQCLSEYFDEPKGNFHTKVAKRIRQMVREKPGILLCDIRDELETEEQDTLFFMVVRREVSVDLANDILYPNYRAHVYASEAQARGAKLFAQAASHRFATTSEFVVRAGTTFVLHGTQAKIVKVLGNLVTIEAGEEYPEVDTEDLRRLLRAKKITSIINATSEGAGLNEEALRLYDQIHPTKEWPRILRKLDLIQPYLYARTAADLRLLPPKTRSVFRYLAEHRDAEAKYGIGFGALGLRDEKRKGDPQRELDPAAIAIMEAVINEKYATKTKWSKELSWGEVRRRCKRHRPRLDPPSRTAFYAQLKRRKLAALTRAREGDRAGNALAAAVWDDELDGISIDGEHAFAVAHIDHTQMDCETLPSEDGLHLGRPWLTVMVSPRYRRILAVTISYESPSYRSCMAVIRECVRKHGRLPQIVVTDGGPDFQSHYFGALLHRFNMDQKFRPHSRPRFGAVLERLNLVINTKLLNNFEGSTVLMKEPRNVSKSHHPRRLATMPLWDLADKTRKFCYEFLDTKPDPITGKSPRSWFEHDKDQGGPRSHKLIVDDDDFRRLTLPGPKTGMATICARQGIVINRIPYRCDPSVLREHGGKKVPVKYDPDDFSRAYAFIDGGWIELSCEKFATLFKGLDEKQVKLATTELIGAARSLGEKRRAVTATALAEWFFRNHNRPDVKLAAERSAANKAARPGAKGPTRRRRSGISSQGNRRDAPALRGALAQYLLKKQAA